MIDRLSLEMNLKKQLRSYINDNGMTATQLAKLSGVSKQNISDWLAGRSPRNLKALKKVANCMNVSVDQLLFGETLQSDRPTMGIEDFMGDDWISGVFEIKVRRVKK